MIKDLLIPLGILAALASMLLPLPPEVLDFLLITNLILALLLLGSTLYISDSLKLSSLPTILLLATLYRLALNVSTTRLILSNGDAGEVIKAFGAVVAQGNLTVGLVVFLVITLVQFIVVAKGSERVAEVAARFTLDAMPGKQMSIDADLRAGVLDFEGARLKRQELQTESRFYGALDGAMKFVKGDAIAGIIIVVVNLVAGFGLGVLAYDLDVSQAAVKFSVLTIGDGLLTQIPSLLNSLAAGMVVTRVSRGDGKSLAHELLTQLGQSKGVQASIGLLALGLTFFSGLPMLPLIVLGLTLVISGIMGLNQAVVKTQERSPVFKPRVPALISVIVDQKFAQKYSKDFRQVLEEVRNYIFENIGLVIPVPEIRFANAPRCELEIQMRGFTCCEVKIEDNLQENVKRLHAALIELVNKRAVECIDDTLTRRMLDFYENDFPEFISAIVPGTITVTQLSELLKHLVLEGLNLRNFDLILQAVAETGSRAANTRLLLEEVRIALKRQISAKYARNRRLEVLVLDPLLDLAFVKAEREKLSVDPKHVEFLAERLREKLQQARVLLTSRGARLLVREMLSLHKLEVSVVAHEEVSDDVNLVYLDKIEYSDPSSRNQILEALAVQ